MNKFLKDIVKLLGYNDIHSDQDFFSFIKKHEKKYLKDGEEIFFLVDTKDEIRRDKNGLPLIASRKKCHHKGSRSYIHRASDFIIVNSKGEILLSKRSDNKDTYPGFLEIGGGHCGMLGYEETLIKELGEELGIKKNNIKSIKIILKHMVKMPQQWQYSPVFEVVLKAGINIKQDDKEVVGHKRYSTSYILDGIINDKLSVIPAQKTYLLYYLFRKGIITDKKILQNLLKKEKILLKKGGVSITHLELF